MRVAQKWKSIGRPLDDVPAMLRWVASLPIRSQKKLSRDFRLRVDQLRIEQARGGAADGADIGDSDYAEFLREHATNPNRDSSFFDSIKRQQDAALFKLQRAQARGDPAAVKDAMSMLAEITRVVNLEELRALKTGKEVGELIPLVEWERQVAAFGAAAMRSIDAAMPTLCRRCVGKSFPEEIRAELEPVLLSARFFEPFVDATRIASGQQLSERTVAKLIDVVDDYIESGAPRMRRALTVDTLADGAGI